MASLQLPSRHPGAVTGGLLIIPRELRGDKETDCSQLCKPKWVGRAASETEVTGSMASRDMSVSSAQRGNHEPADHTASGGEGPMHTRDGTLLPASHQASRLRLPSGGASPVAGLVTWQSPCSMRFTGQAAGVGQVKVYSQSSTALMNMGLEFCKRRTGSCCRHK